MTSAGPLALCFGGLAFLIYLVYTAVYRLYLSPLANIPGPKLAALTFGYEMYYDLVEKARFPWKIEALHEQYGIIYCLPFKIAVADLKHKVLLSVSPRTKFI